MALAVARATSSAVCRRVTGGSGDPSVMVSLAWVTSTPVCMADDQDAGPSDEQPGFNDAGDLIHPISSVAGSSIFGIWRSRMTWPASV